MILKTKITTTEEKEIEIPVPSFWRNQSETVYIGLIDEKTVIEMIIDSYESSLRSFNNSSWEAGFDRIRNAHLTYSSCTQSEFLSAFDKMIESVVLNPVLES